MPTARPASFAILAIILSCAFPLSASADGLDRVKSSGVLRWGGDVQGGEPYAYYDPHDSTKLLGFEAEIATALARELGVRAEFVQNDWSNLVPSLERGSFDVILNGLEITEARKGRIGFSRPYYIFAERLMVRRGERPVTLDIASFAGKRIGTLNMSLADQMIRAVVEPVLYEGVEEPYADLANGRLDAVLLDDIIAARYGMPKKDLEVLGDVGTGEYAMGLLPSEPELKDAVDGALTRIIADGELETILRKYEIYNDRQAKLEVASNTSSPSSPLSPTTPTLTGSQLLLFLRGAMMTLLLSTLAMTVAIPLGLGLALVQLFAPRWAGRAARFYIEVYRGTPVLLQLYVLYYGLAPVLRLDALAAGMLGLGMNYAAYEAETYRAGMMGVPKGQLEAAVSLGMDLPTALRRVVLPQALRLALPNVANDFIALLKDSSLVGVITVVELTKQMTITAVDLRGWLVPGLLCATLYLAMSYPLARLARRLEARLERA
jgi:polar amino acid transport system substrate-binding protein